MEYKYKVDHDKNSKLAINVDMTVKMPCNLIGADVLDIWGRDLGAFIVFLSHFNKLCC